MPNPNSAASQFAKDAATIEKALARMELTIAGGEDEKALITFAPRITQRGRAFFAAVANRARRLIPFPEENDG